MIRYPWKAIYADGLEIEQYLPDGTENSFGLVAHREEMPVKFVIGRYYTVDLLTGAFSPALTHISYMVDREPYVTIPTELIYFRRSLWTISPIKGTDRFTPDHFFGYKYKATLDGRPEVITGEILMCVTEQGKATFYLGVDP